MGLGIAVFFSLAGGIVLFVLLFVLFFMAPKLFVFCKHPTNNNTTLLTARRQLLGLHDWFGE